MSTADISNEVVREYIIAAHADLEKVKAMLAERHELLTMAFDWGPQGGLEDGLGAASHVGNRPIAEFYLSQGVPNTICAAAMLGDAAAVKAFLDSDPAQANARGAHGITVMFHAALSGDTTITQLLKDRGCKEGFSHALHAAILSRQPKMVEWLLAGGVQDVNMANWEGKSPLTVALETEQPDIAEMLKAHGGQ
jgi:ankyrin repeat protein